LGKNHKTVIFLRYGGPVPDNPVHPARDFMPQKSSSTRAGFPGFSFAILFLLLLAALLVWKGLVWSEAVGARQFLDMTDPAVALQWWFMAGGLLVLVMLGVAVRSWLKNGRARGAAETRLSRRRYG
jgi:hypothetical protein